MKPRILRRFKPGTSLVEYQEVRTPEQLAAAVELGFSDDEIDRDRDATKSVDKNWPSFRYPPGGGPASGRIFASASDVPDGWMDTPTGSDPAAPPPAPKAPATQTEAVKRVIAAQEEAHTLRESVAVLEAENAALRRQVYALKSLNAAQARFQSEGQEEDEGAPAPAKRKKAG